MLFVCYVIRPHSELRITISRRKSTSTHSYVFQLPLQRGPLELLHHALAQKRHVGAAIGADRQRIV